MNAARPAPRKIIHVDMDAYYAAIEQRDDPALRGRPVVVGGDPHGRGVVATASYEARAYGIHSAMPAARALRLCPEAVFLRPRFERYRETTALIHAILHRYSAIIEPLSLDEAYLDVTSGTGGGGSATRIAEAIRAAIREATGLTASAGVSYNKCLAKLASDLRKPDGLTVIPPGRGAAFIAALPVERLPGVGPATARRLRALGVLSGADLRALGLDALLAHFGRNGAWFHRIAQGIDERPVRADRERKSIGCESTFEHDLRAPAEMLAALEGFAARLADLLARADLAAHTLTLKVRYSDYRLRTRSRSRATPYREAADLRAALPGLLARCDAGPRDPVRLLGLTVSRLVPRAPEIPEQGRLALGP